MPPRYSFVDTKVLKASAALLGPYSHSAHALLLIRELEAAGGRPVCVSVSDSYSVELLVFDLASPPDRLPTAMQQSCRAKAALKI
ncbi:MAG: hypothetical protein HQL42_15405 [Alphaproteobacteria bacterium]|nr:hypothetical protein [Alphaproteobacteria bacterium]